MFQGQTITDNNITWKVKNISSKPTSSVYGGATLPIGTIITFSVGDNLPDGFIICNGAEVLISDYPDLYTVIGNTYGTPSDNDHFIIPDLRNKTIWGNGTNNVGTNITAGLPNITGTFTVSYGVYKEGTGAFYTYGNNGTNASASYPNSGAYQTRAFFNASYSNSIYGASTTVQPPALVLIFLIKAFEPSY